MASELDLDAIEQRANAATEGPWRDITDAWNSALKDHRKRTGRTWHAPMRGSRGKRDIYETVFAIVVDSYHGERLRDGDFPVRVDWHDLRKVVCLTTRQLFGSRSVAALESVCEFPNDKGKATREFIAHAREDIPALVKRVRELERIVEESVVSGSELVVGQYVLIREKLAYDEYGYTATAINGTHRPTSLEPKLDLWEAAEQARRWSMFPPPDICAEKGLADGK